MTIVHINSLFRGRRKKHPYSTTNTCIWYFQNNGLIFIDNIFVGFDGPVFLTDSTSDLLLYWHEVELQRKQNDIIQYFNFSFREINDIYILLNLLIKSCCWRSTVIHYSYNEIFNWWLIRTQYLIYRFTGSFTISF